MSDRISSPPSLVTDDNPSPPTPAPVVRPADYATTVPPPAAATHPNTWRQLPDMSSQTAYTLQYMMDYYDHYWRGQYKDWKEQCDQGVREPIFRQLQVPRRRMMPRRADAPPEGPRVSIGQNRKRWMGDQNRERYRQYEEEVSRGDFGVVNYTQPLGLELRKILGKGGEGVACLFRLSQTDGSEREIVVKAATRRENMALEIANMTVRRWRNGSLAFPDVSFSL